MRMFTMVRPQTWQETRFRKMTEAGKLAFLYMMAGPHQNSAGAYCLPVQYAIADLGMDVDRFAAARQESIDCGLIVYDQHTQELFVPGWFTWNRLDNPNHVKGTLRFLDQIESDMIREAMEPEIDAEVERREKAANDRSTARVVGIGRR